MRIPGRFVARELLLIAATVGLWLVEHDLAASSEGTPVAFACFVGLFTILPGALLHEWGHLAGALATGSVVHFPKGWVAKLLFDFDVEANDRRQFLAMSLGGYLGSVIGVALFLWLLPLDRLAGQIAIAGAGLGMLVSMAIEMPTTIRVLRGAKPPPALVRVAK